MFSTYLNVATVVKMFESTEELRIFRLSKKEENFEVCA
jgi:hypothetical protein